MPFVVVQDGEPRGYPKKSAIQSSTLNVKITALNNHADLENSTRARVLRIMDIKRPPKSKLKKKIRSVVLLVLGLTAIGGITYGLTKLKPAAPTMDGGTAVI